MFGGLVVIAKYLFFLPIFLGLTPSQARADYKACREDALKQFKAQKQTAQETKENLEVCAERFPAASLYLNCKKKAIESLGNKTATKDQMLKEMESCKKIMTEATFDATDPMPFWFHTDQAKRDLLYFAGIGTNRPIPLEKMNFPNFDCDKLGRIAANPSEAEYFQFGNHPSAFTSYKDWPQEKAAGVAKANAKIGAYFPRLGKLFGNPSEKTSSLFFPATSCVYNGPLGDIFAGLSSYYLVSTEPNDPSRNVFAPYFGIASYNPTFKGKSAQALAEDLLVRMNKLRPDAYRKYSKGDSLSYIATTPITQFDEQGNPFNICQPPRRHLLLAIIKARDEDKTIPEYILLANVRTLCWFGDRASLQFATKP